MLLPPTPLTERYNDLRWCLALHGRVIKRSETRSLFHNFVEGRVLSAVDTFVITRWLDERPWERGEPEWLTHARKRLERRARRRVESSQRVGVPPVSPLSDVGSANRKVLETT